MKVKKLFFFCQTILSQFRPRPGSSNPAAEMPAVRRQPDPPLVENRQKEGGECPGDVGGVHTKNFRYSRFDKFL